MLLILFLDSEVLQALGIKITATKTKPQVNPDDRICKNVLPLIEQFFALSLSVSQPQNLQLNNASQKGHSCQCSFEILNSSSRAPGSGLPPPDLVKMKANVRGMTERFPSPPSSGKHTCALCVCLLIRMLGKETFKCLLCRLHS